MHSATGVRDARAFTLRDTLVLIAALCLFLIVAAAWMRGEWETANRTKCASQLRSLGQAILLYCNENRGAFPRTVFSPGPEVTPTWGTGVDAPDPFESGGPAPNDVSAAIFLLMRTRDITSEVIVCPSSDAQPETFGGGANTALNRCNFTRVAENLSYSYQNPYPDDAAVDPGKWRLDTKLSACFAIASDINPGTAGGDDVTAVRTTSPLSQMKQANSNNHDGDDQNVLHGDGHIEFQQNPFVGVQRDNIFTRAGPRPKRGGTPDPNLSDGILRSSRDGNDSVLLPTDD